MTERFANLLNLQKTRAHIPPIEGVENQSTQIEFITEAIITSRVSSYSKKLTFLIVKKIAESLPSQTLNYDSLKIPPGIKLADPTFYRPGRVDALIGAEIFYHLLEHDQLSLGNQELLQKTKFGWVAVGAFENTSSISDFLCHLAIDDSNNVLNDTLKRFWEIEEGPKARIFSKEENACEIHYANNTKRNLQTGKYTVRLPFKDNKLSLGESYAQALKRYFSLEQRLERDPTLKNEYTSFLSEYAILGHMYQMREDNTSEGYYLPHHAVIKQSSTTTKVRVVFDASARTTTGVSLNDTLMAGPTIQDDVFSILVQFRVHAVAMTADIEKMYRQINIHEDDKKYQKILWRKNQADPIKTYILNTVTYGTASAPFLAIRTLHQLADDEKYLNSDAARVIKENFYVDDMIVSIPTVSQAVKIRDEITSILKRGGFHLRKWSSNCPQLLNGQLVHDDHVNLDLSQSTKTLGVHWTPGPDILGFNIESIQAPEKITKRIMLSQIAQIYDPLGLLGPVVTTAKIMIQTLWKDKMGWDEVVTNEMQNAWVRFRYELEDLSRLQIPRRISINNCREFQLHGFSDASERAYGACVYLRCTDNRGNFNVELIASKSRVAPLRSRTIPELELCAAETLKSLYIDVTKALKININKTILWSDSTATIAWINTDEEKLGKLEIFVRNRVRKIQDATEKGWWRHVPGVDNPADALSRGQSPSELVRLGRDKWFKGPNWLSAAQTAWPVAVAAPVRNLPETCTRPPLVLAAVLPNASDNSECAEFSRHSTLIRCKRIYAYVLRFIHNAGHKRTGIEQTSGPLTVSELNSSMRYIMRRTQLHAFKSEIDLLKKKRTLGVSSRLLTLSPFIDEEGLLRVGGRLKHANIPENQKHPLLLPTYSKSIKGQAKRLYNHLTILILEYEHLRLYHAGASATLYAVRENYWIINGRRIAKHVIHRCIPCVRARAKVLEPIMGNLPKHRVTLTRPFLITGIDYCGPFYIKERAYRNRSKIKVYVAVFVCFATKAVHLEVVSDLTTEAFLAALRRFFARRGLSKELYSDNGTNFVGANRELRELYQMLRDNHNNEIIFNSLANDGIKWKFIPPRSPHFGGLWEAAVRSFKRHFFATVKGTLLTFEAFNTYVIEIEAILNSRPLMPLSSDPRDLNAITAGHFLTGNSLKGLPDDDMTTVKSSRLSMFQLIQQFKQQLWKRWYKEYLNELTNKKKWMKDAGPSEAIKVDSMVILKEDNAPPLFWPLGRVTEIHPGDDGITRVVTVKTANGVYKRTIKKIVLLPNSD